MVKAGSAPVYRRVADGAVQREARLFMIRIGRAVVQRNMTRVAVFGRVCECAASVTLTALHGCMRSG